jgi:YidC/Oxa1 family membrane protein insertase
MNPWVAVVDALRALLFAVAHLTGGSVGGSILVVSTIIRIALLPVTIRMARRAREHQDALDRLQPQLERLRRRYANDEKRMLEETLALRRQHGVGVLPRGTFAAMLIQAPVYGALYRAIASSARSIGGFLWIRDLTGPDVVVAGIAAALAAAGAKLDASPSSASRAWIAAAAITFVFAWRLASGVGLYWVASSAVGVGQSLVLRRSKQA